MARPNFHSSKDTCKNDVRECKHILKKYNVLKSDLESIQAMIETPYQMLEQSSEMNRAMEAFLIDELGEDAINRFTAKWLTHTQEPGPKLKHELLEMAKEYEKDCFRQDNFKRLK